MIMAAADCETRTCVVCGRAIPEARAKHPQAVTCSDYCGLRQKYRRTREWTRRHDRSRDGRVRRSTPLLRLHDAVEADRAKWGHLRHVLWSADDCPRRRGDAGPCIHVGCRYHACSDVDGHGALWVDPRFEADPYSVPTCVLDLVEPGGWTLDQISEIWDVTRERVRQIEVKALIRCGRDLRRRGLSVALLATIDGENDWIIRRQPESEHWDRPSERALEPCAPMPPGWRR